MKIAALLGMLGAILTGCMNTPSADSAPPPPTPAIIAPVVGHWRTDYQSAPDAGASGERLWIEADGTFTALVIGADPGLSATSLAYLSAGTWRFSDPLLTLDDAQAGAHQFRFAPDDAAGGMTLVGPVLWSFRAE